MIACVRLPYFAAGLEQHDRPDWQALPFVLAAPPDTLSTVYASSRPAAQAGIRPGQTTTQADTLCPDLRVLPARPVYYQQVLDGLQEVLATFTAQVELERGLELRADKRRRKNLPYLPVEHVHEDQAATFYLDLGSLSEEAAPGLAHQIADGVKQAVDLRPAVGLATGKFPARAAAISLQPGDRVVVPAGQERPFLAAYPLTLLPIDGELIRQLHLLGLTTLGQIADLPVDAVVQRFGKLGQTLHLLAQGRDTSAITPCTPRLVLETTHQLETPVYDRTVLEAVLAHLIRTLTNQPVFDGQSVREFGLVLTLENGASWEDMLVLHLPASTAAQLVDAGRELLATARITTGVAALQVVLTGFRPTVARQLSLFDRSPVPQEELRRVLQGLIARYGEDCFYRGRLVNQEARLLERRYTLEKWSSSP